MSQLLKSIYEDIYGPLDVPKKPGVKPKKMANLRELAATLSQIVHREKPWTYRYLNSLLNGDSGFRVTSELATAMDLLTAKKDGMNPLKAKLVEVSVFSVNGHVQHSSIILGESKRCKGCHALIVPRVPWQSYCGKECPGRPKRKAKKAHI